MDKNKLAVAIIIMCVMEAILILMWASFYAGRHVVFRS